MPLYEIVANQQQTGEAWTAAVNAKSPLFKQIIFGHKNIMKPVPKLIQYNLRENMFEYFAIILVSGGF